MTNVIKKLIKRYKYHTLRFESKGDNLYVLGFPIYVFNPHVHIGNNVQLYPNVTFFGEGEIIIGNDVKIGNNVVINATKGSYVKIQDKTIIAANTYIIDSNHGIAKNIPIQNQDVSSSPVEIGEDCWIGASCVIGKGTKLGNGAVIGANSFVNTTIPAFSIAGGTPAKIIKERI